MKESKPKVNTEALKQSINQKKAIINSNKIVKK